MAADYDVGYGRPPRHMRFAPGRSGNPAGRPKGPQTLPADLREELEEAVTLRDGDFERTFSRQRAILRSLTAKAIEGDPRATATVLDLVQRLIGAGPAADPGPEPEPEPDPGSGARARLATKIAKVHECLAATGALEVSGQAPSDAPEGGS